MNHELQHLGAHHDIVTLKPALHSLCSRYGSVAQLDILDGHQAGRHQALCFLRMDSPEQERALMRDLGVGRFGGNLVMVVSLSQAETPQSTDFSRLT
jgi:hypothetical protein